MKAANLGEMLLELCASARKELLLVAPFIKADVISHIIDVTAPSVPFTVVTRWLPHEIRAGVSDLEVWDLVQGRPGSRVLLLVNLHAKYYRADDRCLVGSANLTQRALGLCWPGNIEILVPMRPESPELGQLEAMIRQDAVEASASTVAEMKKLVDVLPAPSPQPPPPASSHKSHTQSWLPRLRHPGDLYTAYLGQWSRLTAASQEAAKVDLQYLNMPSGFSEPAFKAAVRFLLLQTKVVKELDAVVRQPQRFGAITRWLKTRDLVPDNSDPDTCWQTLMRWLLHFLPERYELSTPRHSEFFSSRQQR